MKVTPSKDLLKKISKDSSARKCYGTWKKLALENDFIDIVDMRESLPSADSAKPFTILITGTAPSHIFSFLVFC